MNNSEQGKVNIEIVNAKLDEQDYEELIHFLDKNNFNYWVSDEPSPVIHPSGLQDEILCMSDTEGIFARLGKASIL